MFARFKVNPLAMALAGLCLAISLMTLISWVAWKKFNPRWTAEQVEEAIKAEIPKGTKQMAIERWLQRHNFEHGYIKVQSMSESDLRMLKEASKHVNDIKYIIVTILDEKQVYIDGFYGSNVFIFFAIDNEGNLIDFYVKQIVYYSWTEPHAPCRPRADPIDSAWATRGETLIGSDFHVTRNPNSFPRRAWERDSQGHATCEV